MYYRVVHYQLKDSIFNIENQKKLSSLYAEIETIKKQDEIEDLKALNEIQEQQANLYLITIVAGSIIASLVIILLVQNSKLRQRKSQQKHLELENELKLRSEELRSQAARMISLSNGIKEVEDNLRQLQKESAGNYTDVQAVLNSIKINKIMEKEWENFEEYFGSVHNEFYARFDSLSLDFTIAEKRLAGLIRMNLTNSEIASILNIESNSVKIAKYRLKKKLGLNEDQSINKYLSSL